MQPAYEALSEAFGEDPEDMDQQAVTIAQVDCTANPNLCRTYNIGGYPTLLLFRNGKFAGEFEGQRTQDAMETWIRNKLGMKARTFESGTPEDITDSFHSAIKRGYALVRFFAPWCSHCVAMRPVYERLAGAEASSGVKIAEVDCTKT